MVTGATPGGAAARAGSRKTMGLPDPNDSAAGLWGLLVQPARLGGGAADVRRTRARLRRLGFGGRVQGLGLRRSPGGNRPDFPARAAGGSDAMARSSHLEGRIAAIVDASRVRRGPRALLMGLCGFGVLAFI